MGKVLSNRWGNISKKMERCFPNDIYYKKGACSSLKKGYMGIGIIIAVIVVLGIMLMSSYNGFVTSEENVDQSYAQIETQLQRRLDLIPNLVNTVKGYASHEKEVLTQISDARARLAGANTPEEEATANTELTGALSRLLVVVENYPNLKADQQFTQLMDELSDTL